MPETSQALELFDSGFAVLCSELMSVGVDSVSVQVGSGKLVVAVFTISGSLAGRLAELDAVCGEGPRSECLATCGTVYANLGDAAVRGRWPGFVAATAALGVSHAWAVPIGSGSSILAVLVAVATDVVVDVERIASACEEVAAKASGYLLAGSAPGSDWERAMLGAAALPDEAASSMHRAVGFLAAQHDLSMGDAETLFRALVISSGATAAEVADRILNEPRFTQLG